MDFATFNGLYTLFLIIIFVALIFWAYSKKQKKSFDNIANSIFDEPQDSVINENIDNKQSGDKKQ
jgi:cytochrome c oxidase cbb3-type subunit IV